MLNPHEYLEIAKCAACAAGKLLADSYTDDAKLLTAAGKDIKTEADITAEAVILDKLNTTNINILSEERGLYSDQVESDKQPTSVFETLEAPLWIIDPLDGTFNFMRGFPCCCVSIALWEMQTPVLGVIYDFTSDLLYYGSNETSASCNGKPIQVSEITKKRNASLATGFPSSRDYSESSLQESIYRIQQYKKIRMLGSAARSLCYVAEGKLDAYHEEDIWLWDVAAGLAIVSAAGGQFSLSQIKENWQLNVFASNQHLHSNDIH